MTDAPSTTDRIIHAALSLIASDGLGAVTMRRIAETAGVARQTLYNHYPDVDSIVVAAVERHDEESIRLLESTLAVVDRPAEKVEQLVRHFVAVGAHTHHSQGIEHGLSAEARQRLGAYERAVEHWIRQILQEGQSTGAFHSDLEMEVDVDLIRRMLEGLSEQTSRSPDESAAIARAGTRTILASIGAS
ncbi:MAG: TetR/AcrR family transcriptional regulator [Acidimicrobiia bacterium]|nr:TetR/AcrR family transcriptional regulator [Acidimicrobiia bacterium]